MPPGRRYQNYKKKIEKIITELDQRGLIPKGKFDTSKKEKVSVLSE